MIRLENVTKYYSLRSGGLRGKLSRKYVLNDVTITFPTGANIGILGPNGAGKSTLLRLLGGIETPNVGKIWTDQSISWPVGLSAGFQGSLTARENCRFVCQIYRKTREESRRIIDFVTDFAEIGDYFDMPIKTFSSGMKARINFGLSMAFDFDYYLIDEVTGVGDASFKKKAKALFKEKTKKAAMILVSHDMRLLREQCDVAIYLNHGNIMICDSVDDAINRYQNKVKDAQTA